MCCIVRHVLVVQEAFSKTRRLEVRLTCCVSCGMMWALRPVMVLCVQESSFLMLSPDFNGNNNVVIFMSQEDDEEITRCGQFRRCTVVVVFLFWAVFIVVFVCLKNITVSHEGLDLCVQCRFVSVFRCRASALEQQSCLNHKCSKGCHFTRTRWPPHKCHSKAQHDLGALFMVSSVHFFRVFRFLAEQADQV